MKSKTMAIAALALAMAGAGVLQAREQGKELWLHINVHEGTGGRVNVNLPISVVEKAAALIPDDARHSGRLRLDHHDMSAAELRDLWRAVKDGPDATYVTVDERDGKVRVAKSGGYLLIRADDPAPRRSQVDVRMPVAVVEALLAGSGDDLDVGAAVAALARQGEGELVTVNDDKDTVRIWVDAAAESR